MVDSTTSNDLSCDECASLGFDQFNPRKWCYERIDEWEYPRRLHEICHQCDDAERTSLVKLCNTCRHLRFRHLLLCCRDIPSRRVRLYPLRSESQCCDFCRFLASYAKKMNYEDGNESCFSVQILPEKSVLRIGKSKTYLHAKSHPDQIRVPGYVDWTWLRHCVKGYGSASKEDHRTLSLKRELREIHVVDVFQSCVVSLPPKANYVTLSYVWSKSEGQFEASKSDVHIIQMPGGLQKIKLPPTIRDAITVCKILGQRFLWVDRLCIIQDDSWENTSVQLNQMASIYNQSSLTIVAAAGDGATYGLAGISRRREPTTQVFRFNESFVLGEAMPSLSDCLKQCKWLERGWTYQEYIASSSLLYFTDSGVYHDNRSPEHDHPLTERTAIQDSTDIEVSGRDMIHTYTRRELTYPADILRAFSGILTSLYGEKISFGLPWEDFDRAILWKCKQFNYVPRASTMADTFPSWSWSSVTGGIECHTTGQDVYSLAYWGRRKQSGEGNSPPQQWLAIGPPHKRYSFSRDTGFTRWIRIAVGLALSNGCVRSKALNKALSDCSTLEYMKRLREKGEGYMQAYWTDVFQAYADLRIFENIPTELLSVPGCLAVHTQKVCLMVDPRFQHPKLESGKTFFIIRTRDGEVAGSVSLSAHAVQRVAAADQIVVQCLALSITSACTHGQTLSHFTYHAPTFNIPAFYGCPCASHQLAPTHITPCPQHPDFWTTDLIAPWPTRHFFSWGGHKEHVRALQKHLVEVSYPEVPANLWRSGPWDSDETMDYREFPPELNVMLIAPTEMGGVGRGTYRRLGIGTVYLRRWVEAEPMFETVVLE